MPCYRIHRIKDGPRENYRWAAHAGGEAIVKPKDYEGGNEIEAATPYAAWKLLSEGTEPLRPGDLLQLLPDQVSENKAQTGDCPHFDPVAAPVPDVLFITKYIGFEPAKWFVPEPKKAESATEFQPLSSEPLPAALDS